MAFKNSIKEIRLKNKLSKVEMAKKLDVSEGTIRMWENGKNEPRMGMVEKISDLFNVSKGFLLVILKKWQLNPLLLKFLLQYLTDANQANVLLYKSMETV